MKVSKRCVAGKGQRELAASVQSAFVDGKSVANRDPVTGQRLYPVSVTVAAALLTLLIAASLGADVLRPLDNRTVDLMNGLKGPSLSHPFGTDRLGRDLLAYTLHGLRVSFVISATAACIAVMIGCFVGLLAGSFGGRVDWLLMRSIDVFQSQNHFLFGMLLVVLFRPVLGGGAAITLSVACTHWVVSARIVRAELLFLQQRPFVLAAIGSGAGRWRVLCRHFLPHLLPSVVLSFVLLVPHAIFHETSLSFLGLGLSADEASLGNLLAASQESLLIGGWWMAVFPGLIIFVTCLSVGIVGEYWRERHHPRQRAELGL